MKNAPISLLIAVLLGLEHKDRLAQLRLPLADVRRGAGGGRRWKRRGLLAGRARYWDREALGIGTLMNARGLMELIIINIGLQRGIISEGLFAVLVIMAVVTTLMTSPLFDRLAGTGAHQPISESGTDAPAEFEIAR